MKLNKSNAYKKYKGLLVPPAIQDFLVGRIWIKDHTPFPQPIIDTLIRRGILQTTKGIDVKPIFKCNRCHNTNPAFLVTFQCAKCGETCVYCRHCIRMGRIASCTTLISWANKQPHYSKQHAFEWEGTLTEQQQQTAHELIESLKQKRSHLLHAV